MSSFNGLKKIAATDIQNSGRFYLGNQVNAGTIGQALVSGGPNEPARWDIHTGTINPLTAGSNITYLSGNPTFDGSIADTIQSTDTTYTAGNGIQISGSNIIQTKTDNQTIRDSGGGSGNNLEVIKVPNDLTFTGYATGTYNGFSALSINLVDTDTTYQGSATIDIDTATDPDTINVIKVPNDLTISQNGTIIDTFNGSAVKTIDLVGKYIAGDGIDISGHTIPHIEADTDEITITHNLAGAEQLSVLKVPNDLTFTGYATGTYNGSSTLSINLVDTDTTYQGGTGISIDTTTTPDTINCKNIPNTALLNSTISGISLGSNLANLTFYNSSGGFITSYNGANPPTSITLDGDTTYTAGTNLTLVGTTFNVNSSLTSLDNITMTSTPSSTSITGNDYPSNPTDCSYLDLSSTTNIIPGGVLATKIQRTSLIRICSTSYIELTSNFRTSFKAQSPNVYITLSAILRSDNKVIYGGLYDYINKSWVANTRTRFCYNDETDQDFGVITWFMTGLTPGNTYYISPYFRGNASSIFIIGGSSGAIDGNAPIIMRIYDGGNNVSVY